MSSNSDSDTVLPIVAAVLGGLGAVLLVVLVVRACYWRRLKIKRQSEITEIDERFSLEVLSRRLDESVSGASARQHSVSTVSATPGPERSGSRSSSISNVPSVSSPYYNNVSSSPSRTRSSHGRSSDVSVVGSFASPQQNDAEANDSASSLDINPQYRSSTSSVSHPVVDLQSPPTAEISSSALTRPYAMLGNHAQNSLAPVSAPVPRNFQSSPRHGAARNGAGRSPAKRRAESIPEDEEVFMRPMHESPSKQVSQKQRAATIGTPGSCSSTDALGAEHQDEYVFMAGNTGSTSSVGQSQSSMADQEYVNLSSSGHASPHSAASSSDTYNTNPYQNIIRMSSSSA